MIEKQPITTRERLLDAACIIFAEKGFHNATVSDICTIAEANIAAINYHFSDKERLYDEVWRRAFSIANEAHPIQKEDEKSCDAEQALYTYAHAILKRIFSGDETGLFAKLLCREMANPTLALGKIADEALHPQSECVNAIVKEVLGPDCDETQLQLCKLSIIGQCAFYNFSTPLRKHITGKSTFTASDIKRTARHIAQFSLGGLENIKQQTRNSK